jgi:acyl-CoA reductase-like NAD-dependent aldehyde dehydrogenase
LQWLVEKIAASELLPAQTLQILYGEGKTVGQALCADPNVDMMAFVGSTRVGREIESLATAHGKRVACELGGSNYVLVYADADLPAAAREVIRGGFRNGGQACIAGAHVLVAPAIAKRFLELLQSELQQAFPQDCQGGSTTIEPMISVRHRARIADMIAQGQQNGLQVLEGSSLSGQGNKIGPVIFTGVPISSPLLKEEVFGPLMTVSLAEEAHFIDIANASGYGLAAYAWTSSLEQAMQLAKQLRVGRLWINTDPHFWPPELPVGGFGLSGTGRELGPTALETYSLSKSVMLS